MDKTQDFVLTDEAIAEQGKTAEVDDNFRNQIVSELGLSDDEDNKELVDKIVERESKLRSGYGELLGKKYIPLKKAFQDLSAKASKVKDLDPESIRSEAESTAKATVLQELNENFLDESDYSDELKEKIRSELTRNPGKTAQWVTKNSDFVQFHINQHLEAKKVAESANNGTGEGRSEKPDGAKMPDKFLNPQFMMTDEGRKEFAEWEASKK